MLMDLPTNWRDVDCPRCGAKKGRWCLQPLSKQMREALDAGCHHEKINSGDVKKKNMPRRPDPHPERLAVVHRAHGRTGVCHDVA